jgi:thiamine biosynthesis protein ThiI
MNSVIVRYDEIGLKGHNRPYFEKLLANNMKACMKKSGISYEKVKRFRGRMIVSTEQASAASQALQNVFGIASLSPAIKVELDFEQVKKAARELAKNLGPAKTFRITTKRLSKKLMESRQINEELGSFIQAETGASVELVKPDVSIGVDVLEDEALVFTDSLGGARGLPVGCEGKALCILSLDSNSMAAAWLMLKRGCKLVLLSIIDDLEKYKQAVSALSRFSPGAQLKAYYCLGDSSGIYSLAKEVSAKETCLAIFDGLRIESPELICRLNEEAGSTILRPLDGFDDEEIKRITEKFGLSLPKEAQPNKTNGLTPLESFII